MGGKAPYVGSLFTVFSLEGIGWTNLQSEGDGGIGSGRMYKSCCCDMFDGLIPGRIRDHPRRGSISARRSKKLD